VCSAVYITGVNGIILRLGERERIKEGERKKERERERTKMNLIMQQPK